MELIIVISSLIANGITQLLKRPKVVYAEDELQTRQTTLRVCNALFGVLALISASVITGQEMNMTELQGFVEVVILGFVTYLTSQGMFFTAKK